MNARQHVAAFTHLTGITTMTHRRFAFTSTILAAAIATALPLLPANASAQDAGGPQLAFKSAKVTIDGTSNVHDWMATSSTVKVARAKVADAAKGAAFWDAVIKPGAIETFEVAIPVTTLTSPRSGLDKNMYKALNAEQHKDITFRLTKLTAKPTPGAFIATGILRVAGVEKEVNLDVTLGRAAQALVVKGTTDLLMTDFGIEPPKALLGTVRSSPKVTISFETVLTSPMS